MANQARAGGLRLFRQAQNQPLEVCICPADDANNVFIGDAVKILTTEAAAIGQGPIGVAVTPCAAGDTIYGVVESVLPQFTEGTAAMDLQSLYRKASTATYVSVRRANIQDEYVISDDGTAIGAAKIGMNTNLVATAGNTTTGLSNFTANHSAAAGNATRQLHIVGVLDVANNDSTLGNAQYIVTLNNIYTSGGTGTIGV